VRPPSRRLGTSLLALVVVVVIGGTWAAVSSSFSSSSSPSPSSGGSFSLLQMNLCLSGRAGCYSPDTRVAALDEAAAAIDDRAPDAVTVNEACRRDAADLARRTGYELSFAPVDYAGAPLPCIDPGGRGLFGIAVLTRDDVTSTRNRTLTAEADPEERRWVCATTSGGVTVCTAHLSTRLTFGERADNDAQCRELRSVLAGYERTGTTMFGGDLNRTSMCAPSTMWSARDTAATQSPGLQHIYGTGSLDESSVSVAAATHTDHDFLLATARSVPTR
jgi:endonuclease/exonuclease/phosphatase family metal-dependent hydrolase